MDYKLSQIFNNMSQVEPPIRLKGLILRRIEMEKSRLMKRKMVLIYSGLSLSSGAFLFVFFSFGNAILKSDFWNLLSLIFSDAEVVISHWSDFVLSLLETLPVVSITVILIPVFAILLILNYYSKLSNKINYNLFLTH